MYTRQFDQSIRLSLSTGFIIPATLNCEARYWNEGRFSRRRCSITLRCDRCELHGEGDDFFDAFCRVREALEPHGLMPLCYGASRNVYPSGMARDMADGLSAQKFHPDKPTTLEDRVSIFAEGPDMEPVSVKAQRDFWEACLRSLEKK